MPRRNVNALENKKREVKQAEEERQREISELLQSLKTSWEKR